MAAASVNELVARNVPDGSLLSFRQNVERDLVGGRSPASALDARTKALIDDGVEDRGNRERESTGDSALRLPTAVCRLPSHRARWAVAQCSAR
jgi:hypothetical protein